MDQTSAQRALAVRQITELAAIASSGPTIAASSTLALAANPLRKYAGFVNNTAEDMALGFGVPAVLTVGITLKAYGGSYEITRDNLFLGAVYAINTSGSLKLGVVEGT